MNGATVAVAEKAASKGCQNIVTTFAEKKTNSTVASGEEIGGLGLALPTVREHNEAWYVTADGKVFNATGFVSGGKTYWTADLYTESVKRFADNRSYSIINGESLTYRQFGERVEMLKSVLRANGVKKGYKVAILGASMPNWPVSYFAITTMGAVAVPLLPDFTAFEIANILDHSSTTAIIVRKGLRWESKMRSMME